MTSSDASVRRLGSRWKPLQRLVYLAALATVPHWIFVHNNLCPVLVHFVPLAGLELYRLWRLRAAARLRGSRHELPARPHVPWDRILSRANGNTGNVALQQIFSRARSVLAAYTLNPSPSWAEH